MKKEKEEKTLLSVIKKNGFDKKTIRCSYPVCYNGVCVCYAFTANNQMIKVKEYTRLSGDTVRYNYEANVNGFLFPNERQVKSLFKYINEIFNKKQKEQNESICSDLCNKIEEGTPPPTRKPTPEVKPKVKLKLISKLKSLF